MDVKEQYQPTAHMEKSEGKKIIKLSRTCRLQQTKVQYLLHHINFMAMKTHPETNDLDHSNFNSYCLTHYTCTISVSSSTTIFTSALLKNWSTWPINGSIIINYLTSLKT